MGKNSKPSKAAEDSESNSDTDLLETITAIVELKVAEYMETEEESSDEEVDIIECKLKSSRARLPIYASQNAAGADLCIMDVVCGKDGTPEPVLSMDETPVVIGYKYRTGVCVALEEGTFGMLVPRSSFIRYNANLLNEVGIIDADYRGEILIALGSRSNPSTVMKFDSKKPVFQLVIMPCIQPTIMHVDEFAATTERGEGGFGSTDKRK